MPKDVNAAYRKRASKRGRALGTQIEMGENVVDAMIKDRQRLGRKQYRYRDLQGQERQEMLRLVRDCALAAMTMHEIAEHFGVTVQTLNLWMTKDPEFAIALRLPRELADDRVEKALYHRAVGYSFRTEEVRIHDDGRVTRVPTIKHVPPDVTAATFWLKNRRGHLWKEKQDIAIEGEVDVNDKAADPRALAMAVLDVIQQANYAKLGPTIDHNELVPSPVASKPASAYTEEEVAAMSAEEYDAYFELLAQEEEQ